MWLISFRGRVRRPVFVACYALTTAAIYGVSFLALILMLGPCPPSSPPPPTAELFALGVVVAAILAVRTSFEVRRLHDMSRPGGWAIAMLVATVACPLIATQLEVQSDSPTNKTWPLVYVGLMGAYFLLLALTPGSNEENRYGPRPPHAWSVRTPPR